MEQTTVSDLPALLDEQKLAEIQTLPEILSLNRELADKATDACAPVLLELQGINMQEVEAAQMEATDAQLNELQLRVKSALDKAKGRREPYTKFFDDIRSLFTAEEKRITDLGVALKVPRDAWAKEKGRRAQEADRLRQLDLAKKQEAIELRARVKATLNDQFTCQLANAIREMQSKLYSVALPELDMLLTNLRSFDPVYTEQMYGHLTVSLLTTARYVDALEVTEIKQEIIEECYLAFQQEYAITISAERDRLAELIPSRRRELEEIAAGNQKAAEEAEARRKQEQEAAEKALADQQAAKEAQAKQETAAASMNAAFDVAATAGPSLVQSSGTRVKKTIVADSHSAWAAIMQLWVTKAMPSTDLATLEKKLGFMKTFADKYINDTDESLASVKVEDDYSTSARKKTA